jgi:hypothetical protein
LPSDAIGAAISWLLLSLAVASATLAVNWVMRNRPGVGGRARGRRELLLGYVIPILLASIAGTVWFSRTVKHLSDVLNLWAALAFVATVVGGGAAILDRWSSDWENGSFARWAPVPMVAIMPTVLFVWLIGYLILPPSLPPYAYVILGPSIVLVSCALFIVASLMLGRRVSTRDWEWVCRIVTSTLQVAGAWSVICLLVFAAPAGLMGLGAWRAVSLVVGLLIVGGATAAWSVARPQSSWFAIGAFLAILSAVLLSLTMAVDGMLGVLDEKTHQVVLDSDSAARVLGLTGLLAVFSVITGLQFNVNHWSLAQIYRRRLIRVFLGASFTPRATDSHTRCELAPEDVFIHSIGKQHRPFPVLNMAVNLVADRPEARTVESFTVTPLHAGSSPLGYRPTHAFAGALSLGTVMGISGAAVSPINAGERRVSRAASLLLSLLIDPFHGSALGPSPLAGR